MNLKHTLEEVALQKDQISCAVQQLKSDCMNKDQELIRLRQDNLVSKAGISINSQFDAGIS